MTTGASRIAGRRLLPLAAALALGSSLLAAGAVAAPSRSAAPCNGFAQTPGLTEGPYFSPGSPLRASLVEPGMAGTRLTLTGSVLTAACKPVARALLDFWQADARGVYDNRGYRLRGHQLTDAKGRYTLQTVVPGLYPGRTEHIHVKVQAPGGPVLTTQLYFPGTGENGGDRLFTPLTLVRWRKVGSGRAARFDFVLGGPGAGTSRPVGAGSP